MQSLLTPVGAHSTIIRGWRWNWTTVNFSANILRPYLFPFDVTGIWLSVTTTVWVTSLHHYCLNLLHSINSCCSYWYKADNAKASLLTPVGFQQNNYQ
jgi:hypothetical protein